MKFQNDETVRKYCIILFFKLWDQNLQNLMHNRYPQQSSLHGNRNITVSLDAQGFGWMTDASDKAQLLHRPTQTRLLSCVPSHPHIGPFSSICLPPLLSYTLFIVVKVLFFPTSTASTHAQHTHCTFRCFDKNVLSKCNMGFRQILQVCIKPGTK